MSDELEFTIDADTHFIAKAQAVQHEVKNVVIVIKDEITDMTVKDTQNQMQKDAVTLANALRTSLPAGTFHRLAAEIIKITAGEYTASVQGE